MCSYKLELSQNKLLYNILTHQQNYHELMLQSIVHVVPFMSNPSHISEQENSQQTCFGCAYSLWRKSKRIYTGRQTHLYEETNSFTHSFTRGAERGDERTQGDECIYTDPHLQIQTHLHGETNSFTWETNSFTLIYTGRRTHLHGETNSFTRGDELIYMGDELIYTGRRTNLHGETNSFTRETNHTRSRTHLHWRRMCSHEKTRRHSHKETNTLTREETDARIRMR